MNSIYKYTGIDFVTIAISIHVDIGSEHKMYPCYYDYIVLHNNICLDAKKQRTVVIMYIYIGYCMFLCSARNDTPMSELGYTAMDIRDLISK